MLKMLKIIFLLFIFYKLNANDTLNIYTAQEVDTNLLELPSMILSGDIAFEDSYLEACAYNYTLKSFKFDNGSSVVLGLEGMLVKHRGLQNNFETNLVFMVRYRELFWKNDFFNMDIAYADGLSYALSTPTNEKPVYTKDNPSGYYQLQNLIIIDSEFYTPYIDYIHLFFRLHHRSGVYGLVAPPKVGSNYLGVGLKYIF